MSRNPWRDSRFLALLFGIPAAIVLWALLAAQIPLPRTNDLCTLLIVLGALAAAIGNRRSLSKGDWLAAVLLGGIVGGGMAVATLFTPYPFLGIVHSREGQAVVRGLSTGAAALGGIAILRRDGPVPFYAVSGEWRRAGLRLLLGLACGVPLAVLNVFALRLTQGQPIRWQAPLPAFLDAVQPALVEEVIYRFALWGLLWQILRRSLPDQAPRLAGLLALVTHNLIHLDDLWLPSPLLALGMGTAMAVLWGLPLTFLARRKGLDAAIAFHWVQDAARFLAGY